MVNVQRNGLIQCKKKKNDLFTLYEYFFMYFYFFFLFSGLAAIGFVIRMKKGNSV